MGITVITKVVKEPNMFNALFLDCVEVRFKDATEKRIKQVIKNLSRNAPARKDGGKRKRKQLEEGRNDDGLKCLANGRNLIFCNI